METYKQQLERLRQHALIEIKVLVRAEKFIELKTGDELDDTGFDGLPMTLLEREGHDNIKHFVTTAELSPQNELWFGVDSYDLGDIAITEHYLETETLCEIADFLKQKLHYK